MLQVGGVQQLGAELPRVEGRIGTVYVRHDAGRVFGSVLLRVGGCQDDAAEVSACGFSKIQLVLFDRCVVVPLQIVSQTKGKAIDRIELRIDMLCPLQRRDSGIRLS